jgi:non-specific serine/threonine protein kinase
MLQSEQIKTDIQSDVLPRGVKLLSGQYQIERLLVRGGFGLTYLALDSLDRHVGIKECFPTGLCLRRGALVEPASTDVVKQSKAVLRNFLREAKYLARLEHDNIAKVHQVFKENNTAYIAMECINGFDLMAIREQQPERVTQKGLWQLLFQSLSTLQFIHSNGVFHGDIAPDNILLDAQGKFSLIDFGSAGEYGGVDGSGPMAVQSVKDGYSPCEHYNVNLPKHPSSDLYSLGATLYYLISGEAPVSSEERLVALTAGKPDPYAPLAVEYWELDRDMLESIDKALSVFPADRFQTAEEWLEYIEPALPDLELEAPDELAGRAADEIELDPELADSIAQLVSQTNVNLTPGAPRQPAKAPKPSVADESKETPKQLFDMFGEPIADLDSWLREQDGEAAQRRRREALENSLAQAAENDGSPENSAGNSAITRFFKRLRGQKTA